MSKKEICRSCCDFGNLWNFPTLATLGFGTAALVAFNLKESEYIDPLSSSVIVGFGALKVTIVTLIVAWLYRHDFKISAYILTFVPLLVLVPVIYMILKRKKLSNNGVVSG
jgi:hypothetical protein